MTDETRQIGFIPMSKNGRRHDKRLLDKVDIIRHIPPEVTIWADRVCKEFCVNGSIA